MHRLLNVPADDVGEFRDGLGVRLLRTDSGGGTIQVLRLCRDLAAMRFAICDRVNRLATLRLGPFPALRSADAPPDDSFALEIVSDHVAGVRLSDVLDAAATGRLTIDGDAALHIVRQVLGAIAALHESRGVAHGAIGPERLVLTPRGQVMVMDYVLGQAIEQLGYPAARLWMEFRIPVASSRGSIRFGEHTDVVQVGVLALALLAGRPLDAADVPDRLPSLIDSLGWRAGRDEQAALAEAVGDWLRSVLQLGPRYRPQSARQAQVGLEAIITRWRRAPSAPSPVKALLGDFHRARGSGGGVRWGLATESDRPASQSAPLPSSVGVDTAVPISERPQRDIAAAQREPLVPPATAALSAHAWAPALFVRRRPRLAITQQEPGPGPDTVSPFANRGVGRPDEAIETALPSLMVAPARRRFGAEALSPSMHKYGNAFVPSGLSAEGATAAHANERDGRPHLRLEALSSATSASAGDARTAAPDKPDPAPIVDRAPGRTLCAAGTLAARGSVRVARGAVRLARRGLAEAMRLAAIAWRAGRRTAGTMARGTAIAAAATVRAAAHAASTIGPIVAAAWRALRAVVSAGLRTAGAASRVSLAVAASAVRLAGRWLVGQAAGGVWRLGRVARAVGAGTIRGLRWSLACGIGVVRMAARGAVAAGSRCVVLVGRGGEVGLEVTRRLHGVRVSRPAAAAVLLLAFTWPSVQVARAWWPWVLEQRLPGVERQLTERDPMPGTGTGGALTVRSEPPGAEVWLEGVHEGRAPLTIRDVRPGARTLLVRSGGGSVRTTVFVRDGHAADIVVPIYSGWLAVFAPVELRVLEGGALVGTTGSGRILMGPGEHVLELVGERYGFRATRRVAVKPGEVTAVNVDMPPVPLDVTAPDGAEVFLDGRLLGKAPLARQTVPVGTSVIVMRHPTLGEERRTAVLAYGPSPNRVTF